jgi:signal transduction histidine kinase/CheY-like chemotaxis protein
MKLGLKNRLRLISLLPIVILFAVTSYIVYSSYTNYVVAHTLQDKMLENRELNELLNSVSLERGTTVVYLGKTTPERLDAMTAQRKVVNTRKAAYISNVENNAVLHNHEKGVENCETCNSLKSLTSYLDAIQKVRKEVDTNATDFKHAYQNVYTRAQQQAIEKFASITSNQADNEIIQLSNTYVSLLKAQEYTGAERDLLAYSLSSGQKMSKDNLATWISLFSKADALNYKSLDNKELVSQIDGLLKSKEVVKLFKSINQHRTDAFSSVLNNDSEMNVGEWFSLLSQKIHVLSKIEEYVLNAITQRASDVEAKNIQYLSLSITIWLVTVVLGLLGFLLSNEIDKNIKNLVGVLNKVALDTQNADTKEINLDTTEGTKQAYELLEKVIEQTRRDKDFAQEASEAKSMFLANMSHEIRTPLNGIVGFTELLKDTDLQEEQSEFVEIIEKSSENLLEIINNILDLSKIESNKLEIEDIPFNPIEEFESAVEVYAVRASEKHIDLSCFIDPSLEQQIKGDPTKIKEVIINLLSNAVKFTSSAGAINVDIRKMQTDLHGITRIKFEVQDSGIGVTSEQKAKIFDAFSQADTSITRKYGGTGLGLTISSRFVELMGGQLDLHSEIGKGTTFFFTIDFENIGISKESLKGAYSSINALVLESTHKKKVQDTYLREYLAYYGINYKTFKDVNELSANQDQRNYDLLFIDYEYADENMLNTCAKASQEFILLTKSYYMKTIDPVSLNVFKTIYEPLNSSKIKSTLENYHKNIFGTKTAKAKQIKDASYFNAKVLVAEDNIINQKLIKRTLEELGLTITIASNGLEAFQKRKDGDFSLIFMDIQMPFLDGVEATKEILEYEREYKVAHIPIIALTANALKGDREVFMASGLDEYTTKPLVRAEILSLLNRFLSDYTVDRDTVVVDVVAPEEQKAKIIQEAIAEVVEESKKTTKPVEEAVIIEASTPAEEVVPATPVEEVIPLVEEVEEEIVPEVPSHTYKADILLAKKSPFETKLFIQIVKSLDYTYEAARNLEDLNKLVTENSYKVILFDKELENLDVESFAQLVRESGEKRALETKLILSNDSLTNKNNEDKAHVHEVIRSVANADLLRLLFEKFI